jgi:gamma-glutamyl:cysteine ligase YbdK (ATP-grasp superfamily)
VTLCKELQKTVLEFIPPSPSDRLEDLEAPLVNGIRAFFARFSRRYTLLGLGMHPCLTLDQTAVWDRGESEYYAAYDRLFGIRQHGWLNIQALQVNLEYRDEGQLVRMHNRIRCLLPYLAAVTAASPFVEGAAPGPACNRLIYYRENQRQVPAICNGIIPEPIVSVRDYCSRLDAVYAALRERGAGVLCEEWVASAGVIVRFSRPCIEVKVPDEQECIHADMAVCAFLRALVRAGDPGIDADRGSLLALMEEAIQRGTAGLEPELSRLYRKAWDAATAGERKYLPVVRSRIEGGSLAERMENDYRENRDLPGLMERLARCLAENRPFGE